MPTSARRTSRRGRSAARPARCRRAAARPSRRCALPSSALSACLPCGCGAGCGRACATAWAGAALCGAALGGALFASLGCWAPRARPPRVPAALVWPRCRRARGAAAVGLASSRLGKRLSSRPAMVAGCSSGALPSLGCGAGSGIGTLAITTAGSAGAASAGAATTVRAGAVGGGLPLRGRAPGASMPVAGDLINAAVIGMRRRAWPRTPGSCRRRGRHAQRHGVDAVARCSSAI